MLQHHSFNPWKNLVRLVTLTVSLAVLFQFGGAGMGTNSVPAAHAQASISFVSATLTGTSGLDNPTTLQFGPDNRLYVAQQYGVIAAYTITRDDTGGVITYSVSGLEIISEVKQIPNHNDDGTLNTNINTRQVTGLVVTGTSTNPVLYVTSSDSRIAVGSDSGLDTNSGIVSRLTWNGASWDHVELVRGLPRSEENHAQNGMALDEVNNILYVASGGITNMGAPSNNFGLTPEYTLSAAILSVDLDAIGDTTYDIPTLDDPSRTNTAPGVDENDPFGGNNGANQAKIVPGGPVQVYSPGWRNPYDVVLTEAGRLYSIDNGPNGGWGGIPIGEGTPNCTNDPNEGSSASHGDGLHYITGPGYYAGHPVPARGNPAGIFGTEADSPVPFALANPVECDYLVPGSEDGSLVVFGSSTNGLVEYTASNFGGAMQGDLLTASFDDNIYRMKLNAAGDDIVQINGQNAEALLSGFGSIPLDVTAQGDGDIFPGTIWVAVFGSDAIQVFEPTDFVCLGTYDPFLDEDSDGYSNADEIDAGSNPCSPGSTPADNDGDFVSDVNDDDDDNDSILDINDAFAIDPDNGTTTHMPLFYDLFNADPGFGFFGVGFTGLMINNADDYLDQFEVTNLTVGGAAGKATVDNVPAGDALGALNNQAYAFQFGVNASVSTGNFLVTGRIESPYFDDGDADPPQNDKSQGIFIGTGDQFNYLKIALTANNGAGGVEVVVEDGDTVSAASYAPAGLLTSPFIDFLLLVDPVAGTVQPRVSVGGGPVTDLGSPLALSGSLLATLQGSDPIAVGIIATSRNADPFTATWDLFEIKPVQPSVVGTSPNPADFGSIQVGSSATKTITLFNLGQDGDPDIEITGLQVTGAAAFSLTSGPGLPYTLQPEESVNIDVTFTPIAGSAQNAALVVTHDGTNSPFNVNLQGDAEGVPIYRVNVGGAELADSQLNWSEDTSGSPSPYVNTGQFYNPGTFTGTNDTDAPYNLFASERWDASAAPEMIWNFPVDPGTYEVRLYFAEIYTGTQNPGDRVFDVEVEGELALNNYDIVADVGFNTAVMKSYTTQVLDGSLTVEFIHVVENPSLKGIDVYPAAGSSPSVLTAAPDPLNFGAVALNTSSTGFVTVTNQGSSGDPAITISSASITGADAAAFATSFVGPVTVQPGSSTNIELTFTPTTSGQKNADLAITHNGINSPVMVGLLGTDTSSGSDTASALVEITPGGTINASTYTSQTFKVTNTSTDNQQIVSVRFDLGTAILPDMVFDPNGIAGDVVAKCFTPDAGAASTGLVTFANNCTDPFDVPHDDGFDAIDLAFTDFDPSEQFAFSVDVDPTSIRGVSAPGPNESGSVSGLELVGAQVTVEFDDGSALVADMYRVPSSLSGSQNIVKANAPAAPTIDVIGVPTTPAVVPDAAQTIRVNGPVGANAALLIIEGGLFEQSGGGFDIDPFEANSAIGVSEYSDTIGASGYVDIPVTLAKTDPDGGLNYITAVITEGGGRTSPNSNVVILELDPAATASTLGAAPNPVNFGFVQTGESAAQTITLANLGQIGEPAITITELNLTGDAAFAITSGPTLPVTLNPQATVDVTITFAPTADGPASGTLNVVHDGTNTPLAVALNGSSSLVTTDPIYRVNAGGAALTGTPINWSEDTKANPSPYVNAGPTGNQTYTPGAFGGTNTTGAPDNLFSTERWDPTNTPDELTWDFPVQPGTYEVRLYFAETYSSAASVGARVFDVTIEGATVLDNYDIFADVGFETAVMQSFTTAVSDSVLTIEFLHVVQNPAIKGIEILPITVQPGSTLDATPDPLAFDAVQTGSSNAQTLTLTNEGSTGDPAITISAIAVEGSNAADFSTDFSGPVSLDPGQSTTVSVTFAPTTAGSKIANLSITHDGDNSPLSVALSGTGQAPAVLSTNPDPVTFGTILTGDTSVQTLTLTNDGGTGDPAITISAIAVGGTDPADFTTDFSGPVSLDPGQSTTVYVTFAPTTSGSKTASLSITHDGDNSPLVVDLSGAANATSSDPIYRVNAGGPAISDSPIGWSEDTKANPYVYGNAADNGNMTYSPGPFSGPNTTGAPDALFSTERWDPTYTTAEMIWDFPVEPGSYEVRLYFAETYSGAASVGARVFDVTIEGATVLDNYDIFADVGFETAVMQSFTVTVSDNVLTIEFLHVVQNPAIKGIEIVPNQVIVSSTLDADPDPVDFGTTPIGTPVNQSVTLTNLGQPAAISLDVTSVSISGADAALFSDNFSGPVSLEAGESMTVDVTFTPDSAGAKTASLVVNHTGSNSPLMITLNGSGQAPAVLSVTPIDFGNVANGGIFTQAATLTNEGSTGGPAITISAIAVNGTDAADFTTDFSSPVSLDPGQSATVNVTFTPTTAGSKIAELSITHDGDNSPTTAALSGTSVDTTFGVISFTLVNADTDTDIGPLVDGGTINMALLPTSNLNVRANTLPQPVGSVVFAYDSNQTFRTENVAPYALAGDSSGNYGPWTPTLGEHTLSATPYLGASGSGDAGTPLSITFTVIDTVVANLSTSTVAEAG
ncbi:MAG: choice-of-anchor D domain-containing protein [Anaerolineae bacterium]|nr:choice-of-anchor D domain-containing protein [Anaerolineae bacterium]